MKLSDRRNDPRLAAYRKRYDRSQKKARDDRLGRALIIGVAAAGLLVVGVAAAIKPKPIDPHTGCFKGTGPPPAHTVVLVDETDRLSAQQTGMLESIIRTEYGWLPTGGRLTVRNILADPQAGEDVTVCRMSSGSEAWAGIVSNRKLLEQQFKRTAGAKLDKLLEGLKTAEVQKASPILEAAEQVLDRPDFGPNVPKRRLVIFSDFAQSSPLLDQYKHGSLKSDDFEEVKHDMTGVSVRLDYLRRPSLKRIQTAQHRSFWLNFFRRQMGDKADVVLGAPSPLLGEDPSKPTWVGAPT